MGDAVLAQQVRDEVDLVLVDAYLGVLYRWVNEEDDQFPFEQNLIAALDILLAGITGHHPPAGQVG